MNVSKSLPTEEVSSDIHWVLS